MKRQKNKDKTAKKFKEFREGMEGAEVNAICSEGDFTSGDVISGADTTAFPTYIDKKGQVKHGARHIVAEKIPPGVDEAGADIRKMPKRVKLKATKKY